MNTTDDILKARLKTLGVSEYRFIMNSSGSWTIASLDYFDTAGHRAH